MAEVKAKKKDEMSPAAYNLLCVGDVLVSVQGISMEKTSFDDQLSLLRSMSRPVLLEFVPYES